MDHLDAAEKFTEDVFNRHNDVLRSKHQTIVEARNKLKRDMADLQTRQDRLLEKNGGGNVHHDDLVEINVGGEIVTTQRKILTRMKGTRLEAIFSGGWEKHLQRDREGRVFLDLNASCFRSIVEHLTALSTSPPDDIIVPLHVYEEDEIVLDRLLSFLRLEDLKDPFTIDSVILNKGYEQELYKFLDEDKIDGNLELLYRGSRDGFGVSQFHEKCDNQGSTVTVVKSTEGYVFGGFADLPWSSRGDYKASSRAFLFSLKSHSGSGSTKMRVNRYDDDNALFHCISNGPT
uniref:TLDc domain-containing protein n=1 Tax=Corethron hystrix TaxID=216773 RepID=A0A7S1BY61_9STRA|mmetsp:Transcript_6502/g.14054  ORF Transcript_6502/g.14054 Transcript_6502/m.14054 type:complete len:289 (+) Transcript_6502:115-981(+)